jgi:hypothetical protein
MEAHSGRREIEYPRGSEWRRWDLHIHTPYSTLSNGFGNDFEAYSKSLFEAAIEKEIAVIGVTDYFTIRGYRQLRELQEDEGRLAKLLGEETAIAARRILLLPNIELRLRDIVRVGEKEARINLHVIFSDEVSPQEIDENFLQRLDFTSDSAPDTNDERKALTEANLEALGKRLKGEHEKFESESDLKVGMTQAVVTHEQITQMLERNRAFEKQHLILLAADEDLSDVSWDGQGHLTRKLLVQKAHMLFSANPGTRDFGLGRKHASPEDFVAEFKSLKPCVHGSDAHMLEELFTFAKDRHLWVRANPSFNGLAQLLLGPGERVFVGPEPPALDRVRNSATKSIETLSFKSVGSPDPKARWFSGSVPLNPGLIAVIGKRVAARAPLPMYSGCSVMPRAARSFRFSIPSDFSIPSIIWGSASRRSSSGGRAHRESKGFPMEPTHLSLSRSSTSPRATSRTSAPRFRSPQHRPFSMLSSKA